VIINQSFYIMRKNLLLATSLFFTSALFSQVSQPDLTPNFSAVVVKNLDSSIRWYQSVLGVKIKDRPPAIDEYRIAILESPRLVLELIEFKYALERSKILENKAEGAMIQGYFKIGFKVTDMDSFLLYLEKIKITVDRIYKDSSGKRNFLIYDPDGNLVQFFE